MELQGDLRRFYLYMKVERGLSPRTALEYCRDIDRFDRWLQAEGTRLNDVDTKQIRRWLMGLMEDGSNQPQSVHRKIAALMAYFKWAVREEIRRDNPVDTIERPKCAKRLPKCMNAAEVLTILDTVVERRSKALELRDRAMLELMYGSGLRRAEVCYLSVGDINFDAGMMRVVGKGNKERAVFLGEPAANAIQEYLAMRGNLGPRDPLFLTQRNARMTVRQLWCIFRDYRKAAGLDDYIDESRRQHRVTPHTMRHSYATHMLENGADIMTLKELLGHSSVATTQVYCNVSLQHMRSAYLSSHPRAKVA